MKVKFTFRHMKPMNQLVALAEDKLQRLTKHELVPGRADFIVSAQRHLKHVELKVNSKGMHMIATAAAEDIFEAIDLVIDRVGVQMQKQKSRIQSHKHPEQTKKFKLDHMLSDDLSVALVPGRKNKIA